MNVDAPKKPVHQFPPDRNLNIHRFVPPTYPDVSLTPHLISQSEFSSFTPCFITMFGFNFFVASSVSPLSLNLL